MAEDSSLIHKIFIKTDKAKCIYAIKLFKDERPVILIIDDFLPTEFEAPLHMEDSYLWVFLIQKAKAKLYGTYMDSFNLEQTTE